MNLTGLLTTMLVDPAVAEAVGLVRTRGAVDILGPAGARPPLLALMTGATATGATPTSGSATSASATAPAAGSRPLVVVTATGRDADELASSLRCYLPPDDVAVLPAWETLPHERLSPRADTVARRLAVFRRLAHPGDAVQAGPIRVLVVPVRALLRATCTSNRTSPRMPPDDPRMARHVSRSPGAVRERDRVVVRS